MCVSSIVDEVSSSEADVASFGASMTKKKTTAIVVASSKGDQKKYNADLEKFLYIYNNQLHDNFKTEFQCFILKLWQQFKSI